MLCDVCKTVPFKELRDSKRPYGDKWAIGTLAELGSRQYCDFCSFILENAEPFLTTHPEETPVELNWSDGSETFYPSTTAPGTSIRFISGNGKKGTGRDVTENQIEPSLIKTWLHECQSEHATTCPAPQMAAADFQQTSFRFIDVQRLCIVCTPFPSTFVALSYLWGQTKGLQLMKENQQAFMKDQELGVLWDQIPLTIRDAILLVRKMGLTYLWVDSLCLVQDDTDDVVIGAQKMDLIYEHSLFTIIAANSTDASSGLPGVRNGSRTAIQKTCEVSPGIKLLLTRDIESLVAATKYSTRAWTFQELILSRRRVIFLDDMIYFQCQRCAWREDVHGLPDVQAKGTVLSNVQIDDPDFDSHDILSTHLQYFNPRQATYETDYVMAMAGICRRIAKRTRCAFFYGIPVAAFDMYLLFVGEQSTRRAQFPSWSWAGWSGRLWFAVVEMHKSDWLTHNTWIIWYQRSLSGIVELIWDPATQDVPGDVNYTYQQRFPEIASLDSISTERTFPSWDLPPGISLPQYPILQFWTMVVYYKLREANKHGYDIYDSSETCCGSLLGHNGPPLVLEDMLVEFIIISKVELERRGSTLRSESEMSENKDMYWAMPIERASGLAERKGIAKVYGNRLVKSFSPGPEWKEILLA